MSKRSFEEEANESNGSGLKKSRIDENAKLIEMLQSFRDDLSASLDDTTCIVQKKTTDDEDEDYDEYDDNTILTDECKAKLVAKLAEIFQVISAIEDTNSEVNSLIISIFRVMIDWDIGSTVELDQLVTLCPFILSNKERDELDRYYNMGRFYSEQGDERDEIADEVSWALTRVNNQETFNWLMKNGASLAFDIEVGECDIDNYPEELRYDKFYYDEKIMTWWAIKGDDDHMNWAMSYLYENEEEKKKYERELEAVMCFLCEEIDTPGLYISKNGKYMYGYGTFLKYYLALRQYDLTPDMLEHTVPYENENRKITKETTVSDLFRHIRDTSESVWKE